VYVWRGDLLGGVEGWWFAGMNDATRNSHKKMASPHLCQVPSA
jgi:hypothetical protein